MSSNYAKDINEQLTHTARYTLRTVRIDLDAFLALSSDDRACRWRGWELASKQDVVIQMLTRNGQEWSDELVAQWVAHYDAKWEVGDQAASDTRIPPAASIVAVVKERHEIARQHGDLPGARQLDRVRINLLNGARLYWSLGDLIVQSVNTPGAVYSVSGRSCTCANAAARKATCWHVALYDLLLDIQAERAERADDAVLAEPAPAPAPPVDDGPKDNHGGFRAPAHDVLIIARRAVAPRGVVSPGREMGARIARVRASMQLVEA